METKPYNLQSPEQIAKDYGGNKQKIAEGMQMGIIDPTAGTLAGMFIDRMRSAAQQEQAPQQSVAQQVFTPPAPPAPPMGGPPMGGPPAPAGLGATPEAAQMPPMPGMGGPPPGAPPMGGPPPGAPPMGMAEGGMVPPYMAGGGLSDLPLPDDMFDEPRDGGYANGGIVAFAGSGLVGTDGVRVPGEEPELNPVASRYPDELESLYGRFRDPMRERESLEALYKPEREFSDQQAKFYKDVMSPEAQKARRSEDMWMTLGQIGAKMATTPGSLLQAASAGIGEALPGARESAKERKAEQRDAIKTLAQQEGLKNKDQLELAKLVQAGTDKFGEFDISRLNRQQQKDLAYYQDYMQTKRTEMQVAGGKAQAEISAGAMGASDRAVNRIYEAMRQNPKNKNLTNEQVAFLAQKQYMTFAGAKSSTNPAAAGSQFTAVSGFE